MSWYPIDPTRLPSGEFVALLWMEGQGTPRAQLKPAELNPSDTLTADDTTIELLDGSIETSLTIPGLSQMQVSGNHQSLVVDYIAYKEKEATDPQSVIRSTRWGVGYRLRVTVAGSTTKVDADFGMVAAEAELGVYRADYHLQIFGLAHKEFIEKIPFVGRFDRAAWQAIKDTMKVLDEYASGNVLKAGALVPLPLWVSLDSPPVPAMFHRGRSFSYGLRCVAGRLPLDQALSDLGEPLSSKEQAPDLVTEAYARMGIMDNSRPTKEQAEKVKGWRLPSLPRGPAPARESAAVAEETSQVLRHATARMAVLDIDTATALKVPGVTDAAVESTHKTLLFQLMLHGDAVATLDGDEVTVRTPSAGVELGLTVHSVNTNLSSSLYAASIASSAGLCKTSLKVARRSTQVIAETSPIPDYDLLKEEGGLIKLGEFMDRARTSLAKHVGGFKHPHVETLRYRLTSTSDPVARAISTLFAARQVLAGVELFTARAAGEKRGFSTRDIEATYAEFFEGAYAFPDAEQKEKAKKKAKDWLG